MGPSPIVTIDYTNWKGEREKRQILPLRLFFGTSEWHPTPQWLLEALDLGRHQPRTFALSGMHAPETLEILFQTVEVVHLVPAIP